MLNAAAAHTLQHSASNSEWFTTNIITKCVKYWIIDIRNDCELEITKNRVSKCSQTTRRITCQLYGEMHTLIFTNTLTSEKQQKKRNELVNIMTLQAWDRGHIPRMSELVKLQKHAASFNFQPFSNRELMQCLSNTWQDLFT